MLLCLWFSPLHLHIYNAFSWRAALRIKTAGRAGCCTKEPQQTHLSDAGEGSPVETLMRAVLQWCVISSSSGARVTLNTQHCVCTWTHSSSIPTLWNQRVKPCWTRSMPVWVCLCCVPALRSAEGLSAASVQTEA